MSHKINDIIDQILNTSEHQLLSLKPLVNELVYQLCDITGIEFHPTFFQDQLKNQNSIRILYAAGTANTYIEGPSSGSITISDAGSSNSHENRSPYIVARHIISLSGVYPSRN